jgi:hypothetical protein
MTHSLPVAATSRTVARLVPYQYDAATALLVHGRLCTPTRAASRNCLARTPASSVCLSVKW